VNDRKQNTPPSQGWHASGMIVYVGIAFVVITTVLAWLGGATVVGAMLCAAVLVVLYGRVDDVVEFSLGPLKARLEKNVAESERLLNGLRSMALAQIRRRLDEAASVADRDFYLGNDDLYIIQDQALDDLRNLGIVGNDANNIIRPYVLTIAKQLGNRALGVPSSVTFLLGETAESERQEIMLQNNSNPNPETIHKWLEKYGVCSERVHQLVADMAELIEAGRIQTSDQVRRSMDERPISREDLSISN